MVGNSKDEKEDTDIHLESNNHRDILQVDIVDHYHNLTLKSMLILQYFTTNNWQVLD